MTQLTFQIFPSNALIVFSKFYVITDCYGFFEVWGKPTYSVFSLDLFQLLKHSSAQFATRFSKGNSIWKYTSRFIVGKKNGSAKFARKDSTEKETWRRTCLRILIFLNISSPLEIWQKYRILCKNVFCFENHYGYWILKTKQMKR